MKLLVFSDTHGDAASILEVVRTEQNIHAVFFLGDFVQDIDLLQRTLPKIMLYVVKGNCDLTANDPIKGLVPFGGKLIFYTHGHIYHVKGTLSVLLNAAKKGGAEIVLYGHTHIARHEQIDGIHFFNPGSLAFPRSGRPSYGIIDIEKRVPLFTIKHI